MTLPAREAYRLWAPTFGTETAVSALEDALVRQWDAPRGRLLDLGCGTGRRMPPAAVGVDTSPAMLRVARGGDAGRRLLAADARALPIAAGRFDVVWCRLVLGHLPALGPAYLEIGRVARPHATVIVTDFHPDAVAAGHRRAFRDTAGVVREIEHWVHDTGAHARAAAAAGLAVAETRAGIVGPPVRDAYRRAGRLAWYARDLGLPLVLALRLTR